MLCSEQLVLTSELVWCRGFKQVRKNCRVNLMRTLLMNNEISRNVCLYYFNFNIVLFRRKSMKYLHVLVFAIGISLVPVTAFSQSLLEYIAIPSSGFSPKADFGNGRTAYDGNETGTVRFFMHNHIMFAPVSIPHNSIVTGFSCGGTNPTPRSSIKFTLRRNQPQQANVDMATAITDPTNNGFQFVSAGNIVSGRIDNQANNYYVVAKRVSEDESFRSCNKCAVGFCSIRYIRQ